MAPARPLRGKVCLVTGGARGIGRGIALQLGEAGATVYITGRVKRDLEECASDIKARGGNPIPIEMDHGSDSQVDELFERIGEEQYGKLDILVNNAYAGVSSSLDTIFTTSGNKFWNCSPVDTWDSINGVGLRGHYHCTVLASRLMVKLKQGLIVNISSIGGLKYLFSVAYGIGKACCDRMASDCAQELRESGVTMVSLWPGFTKTEYMQNLMAGDLNNPSKALFDLGESTEFAGKAVLALALDKQVIKKSGRILQTVDLALQYGFQDQDGSMPMDMRQVKSLLNYGGYVWTAALVPSFIRVPMWMMHLVSYKF